MDPKTVVELHSDPQTSPLGPQKDQTKFSQNSNVRIQGTPKTAHEGPKTSKMTPKLRQNQMSE